MDRSIYQEFNTDWKKGKNPTTNRDEMEKQFMKIMNDRDYTNPKHMIRHATLVNNDHEYF